MTMILSFSYPSIILSLLLILSSIRGIVASQREKRLGSSLASSSLSKDSTLESLLQQEASVAWGRLLEGDSSSSSMSMMPGPSPTPRTPPSQTRTLLAMGDSLCTGQLPEPKGTIVFSNEGYVDTLFEYLQDNHDFTTLEKVCCPGEDSQELINPIADPPISDGSFCYPTESGVPSQLDAAVAALESNNVGLISISLGANDIFVCGLAPNPEECITTQLERLVVNLTTILTTLTNGASAPTPIVAMVPYNPYLAFSLSDVPQEQALVPISILSTAALQTAATQVYGQFQVPVVSGNDVFDGLNNSTLEDGIPQNVFNICAYTGMCEETETGGYVLKSTELRNIHPTPEGYEKLGVAHFELVDALLM